jgi:hypothetical protein
MTDFKNEFQAAYALSKSEYVKRDDTELIDKLLALGFYCVVETYEVCCRFTDALLGVEVYVLAAFRTHDDADAFAKRHLAAVWGIRPVEEQVEEGAEPEVEDDIPF